MGGSLTPMLQLLITVLYCLPRALKKTAASHAPAANTSLFAVPKALLAYTYPFSTVTPFFHFTLRWIILCLYSLC